MNTPSLGRKSVENILFDLKNDTVDDFESLYNLLVKASKTNSRIRVPSSDAFKDIYHQSQELMDKSLNAGIHVLDYYHKDFPKRLKNIPDAPMILYVKGNLKALNTKKSIAVIGTREPTDFGIKAGEKLSSIFTTNGFTVVSGLAIGCDTAGHLGCVKENGISIGVLAGGLDKIYPKQSRELADEILEKNGCLLSEYPIGESPRKNYFVERDRLQSGLSEAVIVIETDIKGGTMHTVGFAGKQKRLLACLGGHPDKYWNHPKIQGNNMLVKEGKAIRLSNPDEINNFITLITQKFVDIIPSIKDTLEITIEKVDSKPKKATKKGAKPDNQTTFEF